MGPEQLCLSGLTRSLAGPKTSCWYILLLRVWLVAAFVDLKQSNTEFIPFYRKIEHYITRIIRYN